MRIVHVWSTAGISAMLCNELRVLNHSAVCIARGGYDPFNITRYYKGLILNRGATSYLNYCVQFSKYKDVIHVHGLHELVKRLKLEYPTTKVILHYMGTELSKCANNVIRKENQSFADKILVSTPDLLEDEPQAEWLPNPVDTRLFRNVDHGKGAFAICPSYVDRKRLKSKCKEYGIDDLTIIDRENNNVMYKDMPGLFRKYDTYVDIKPYDWENGEIRVANSTTGLQALSMGLNVLMADGELRKGLPEKHTIRNVTKRLIEIYNE